MPRGEVDIEILHVADCPNVALARRRVAEALERLGLTTTVRDVLIDGSDRADSKSLGSPTVLINGVDPFADAEDSGDLRCRLYLTERGVEGAPSVEQLVAWLELRHAD